MICKRCEDKENRIDGYCSIYCRDMADEEKEIKELEARLADATSIIKMVSDFNFEPFQHIKQRVKKFLEVVK